MRTNLIEGRKAIAVIGSLILMFGSWGCSSGQDSGKTLGQGSNQNVTVEITGVPTDDTKRDKIIEDLKGLTDSDGNGFNSYSSTYSGNQMTVNLSPVKDVDAFSKKISFAKVTKVEGHTVKLEM